MFGLSKTSFFFVYVCCLSLLVSGLSTKEYIIFLPNKLKLYFNNTVLQNVIPNTLSTVLYQKLFFAMQFHFKKEFIGIISFS